MKRNVLKPFAWFGLLVLLVSLACGGGGNAPADEPTQPTAPTQAPIESTLPVIPTDTPAPQADPLLVSSLGDVQDAIIQIEAEGTFVDPEVGWNVNVGKRGSGIIIDPSGIAITNNHVVTGNALLRVWVGGDTSKTYNAVVKGVSECSDLAIIDIEGDGFPYVSWYDGDIDASLKVYAAGFPLGDPQYTLTDGIISKAAANGETSWASVDSVIEHTAKINPGNSGGPLVDENGNLVGINYSIVSETDQNFAISRDEALPIIEQLRLGKNVDSIGVNGGAVSGTIYDLPISGVWVRSVASGSPASNAGIQPGDIIYQLENEVLATDGTMADYCDVLRSRNAGDTMQVTVIRWEDLSLWEGQVNGEEMTLTGYFADSSTGSTDSGDTGNTGDTGSLPVNCDYSDTAGYLSCIDDTGTIIIDVPDVWLDFNGSEWVYDGETIGVAISSSPDLDAFDYDKNMPGVFFGASDTFAQWGGYVQFLDVYTDWYRQACDFDGRYDYNDGLYKGKIDYYSNCDGRNGGDAYVLAAVPIGAETSAMIVLTIQLPDGYDDVLDHMLNSFYLGDM
jgi:serine protease Do